MSEEHLGPVDEATPHSMESRLHKHEERSQARFEHLRDSIDDLKEFEMHEPHEMIEDKVTDVIHNNIYAGKSAGGGMDGTPWAAILPALAAEGRNGRDSGWGTAAALGIGFLAGEFLNGRGRGRGGDEGGGGGLKSDLILQGIGDNKATTVQAALETQLAMSAQSLGIQQAFSNQTNVIQNGNFALLAGLAVVNKGISDAQYVVTAAVNSDGEKTRALINSLNDVALNRLISTQANEIIELRNDFKRSADTAALTLSISNTNTAVAAQQQGQQQAQFQGLVSTVNSLIPAVQGLLQIAHSTAANTSIIAGNSGAVVGGAQSANPVSTNVA
jgi:hypothetical protein